MSSPPPAPHTPWRSALAASALAWLVACSTPSDITSVATAQASGSTCLPSADAADATDRAQPPTQTAAPTPPIELQGQLSIKLGAMADQAAKGLSLAFFWSGNARAGQLDLSTLMGSQVARVTWQEDEVWLTNDKGRQRFTSLDELSEAALGEALPLRALVYWMQGLPDPTLTSQPGPQDGIFIQQGWAIDTREQALKKLGAVRSGTATQRPVQIKIYLDR